MSISGKDATGAGLLCMQVQTSPAQQYLTQSALTQASSLKLSWSDCGAAHGKLSTLSPESVTLGQTTTVTATGSVDEAVTGGTFEIDLKASILSKTFTGDLCSQSSFSLPMGTGTITWASLKCPVAAGSISVSIGILLASSLPAFLQSVTMSISGKDATGAGLLCMQVNTAPAMQYITSSDQSNSLQVQTSS